MSSKVLLVNDDRTFLFIAEKMLHKSQFCDEVALAENGEFALDYFKALVARGGDFRANAPQFIFLDLHMPIMDGWTFLESYERDYSEYFPETNIIIISSTVDREELKLLKKINLVTGIMDMPMTMEKLIEVKQKYATIDLGKS